ncbi:PP2C family serine/threonine-protein phosphatase [Pengzhenrongella frigida]|uniref:Serine/threonine protein phosphatase n=1 Tax=Pengzhenrongella frigida TaxID=1259133 RepID=A0A4Q5N2U6_9MICO|nr:PP2C family serine/threonine-protein phosphatase [Cellulomonas sp. HLT2-17]RYV50927.1 serine/threonine protein phosphatase [Cellulomonas sp. HLT2-17]
MSGAVVSSLPVCGSCGAVAAIGARFCEACGTDLPTPAGGQGATPPGEILAAPVPDPAGPVPVPVPEPVPCRECGGVVDADGYCTSCGAKAPRARDHVVEQPQAWVGAVSDRGIRHHRNEDALAVAASEAPGSHAVLVVCDGVSSSEDSDVASLAAARAALDTLAGPRAQGLDTSAGLVAVIGARLEAAADAASRAVAAATSHDHGDSPPSCTFVATVVERGRIVTGSVGDSRAYWLPDAGQARFLTTDDSWAAEQIAVGVPRDQAESGPQAHAITRWLGVDAPDHTPRITTMEVDGPGWLVVCSDGLWNYCSPADELGALVRRIAATVAGEPLATASALVDWANGQGGHDNITVVLARLGADPDSPLPRDQTGSSR